MGRKFVITYKTSSVHSEDIYVTAGSQHELIEEILDAVWFADEMNHRMYSGEDVNAFKTPLKFKNNRFQVVLYDLIELPGFVSQCVDVGWKRPSRYKVRWENIQIYSLDDWFEVKTNQLSPQTM